MKVPLLMEIFDLWDWTPCLMHKWRSYHCLKLLLNFWFVNLNDNRSKKGVPANLKILMDFGSVFFLPFYSPPLRNFKNKSLKLLFLIIAITKFHSILQKIKYKFNWRNSDCCYSIVEWDLDVTGIKNKHQRSSLNTSNTVSFLLQERNSKYIILISLKNLMSKFPDQSICKVNFLLWKMKLFVIRNRFEWNTNTFNSFYFSSLIF